MKKTLLFLCLFPLLAGATVIDWYCPPHSLNFTEAGVEMDSSFRFELGVFKTGFVPGTENQDQWAANWVPAQRAIYNSETQWFTGRFEVKDNSGDFKSGASAWIWGFSGDPTEGEWILFRHNNWRWPSPAPNNPVARVWRASDAQTILIGTVGGATVLRSARVRNVAPPTTTWAQWRLENFGSRSGEPGEDLNGNGVPDVLEYAFGNKELRSAALKINRNSDDQIELTVPRRVDRPVRVSIEVSPDLKEWYSGPEIAQLHREELHSLVFLDLFAEEEGGTWFWRYTVEPTQ